MKVSLVEVLHCLSLKQIILALHHIVKASGIFEPIHLWYLALAGLLQPSPSRVLEFQISLSTSILYLLGMSYETQLYVI